ncbi:MAG TPA: hypothetical protein VLW05_04925 [Gaiellaceae bacterium]|nr:hypothetical protein [Gaiellaceae bacterium]
MIWRAAVVAVYISAALVFSFVFGGGMVVLAFFAVWGLVWLVFSLFWAWADGVRRRLLRSPSSS